MRGVGHARTCKKSKIDMRLARVLDKFEKRGFHERGKKKLKNLPRAGGAAKVVFLPSVVLDAPGGLPSSDSSAFLFPRVLSEFGGGVDVARGSSI